MILVRALLIGPLMVTAWVALAGTCRLIDHISERRRLHRLAGTTVIRLPAPPSPDHRGEYVPRLAAVPTRRVRR